MALEAVRPQVETLPQLYCYTVCTCTASTNL